MQNKKVPKYEDLLICNNVRAGFGFSDKPHTPEWTVKNFSENSG
jgi:hypothetical protein